MKGSHSRLLQVVITAMLINVAPDGRAETYDLPNISARYPDDYWEDSSYYDAGYEKWDLDPYYEESNDGDRDSNSTGGLDAETQQECDAIAARAGSSCDLKNPPLLVTNGCGSGVTTYLVPDYLTVNGVPVLRMGPIFQGACNEHDVCYGTYSGDKEACDMSLYTDMIAFAKSELSDTQWLFYRLFVEVQALSYSRALQTPPVSYFAEDAFDSAQLSGACRYYSSRAKQVGCLGS